MLLSASWSNFGNCRFVIHPLSNVCSCIFSLYWGLVICVLFNPEHRLLKLLNKFYNLYGLLMFSSFISVMSTFGDFISVFDMIFKCHPFPFRESFSNSCSRWKSLEVHCNNSQSTEQSAASTSDSQRLPELSFNRLQPSDNDCDGLLRRLFGRFLAREAVLDEEYWVCFALVILMLSP